MAMTGQQIYENFMTAPGPQGLDSARTELTKVMEDYQVLSTRITTLAASFEEGWTGDAAGAAQRGAGPLAVEHARASEEMNTAQSLLDGQISSFGRTKNAVVPVPAPPSAPSTMLNIVTFGSASSNYQNKVSEANAAAAKNTAAMDQWTTTSSFNETGMPKSYGSLSPTTVPIAIDTGSGPAPVGTPVPGAGGTGRTASGNGPGTRGTGSAGGPVGTGNPGQAGAQLPPRDGRMSLPPNSQPGSGNNPGNLGGGSSSGSNTAPSSVTTPGGYTPGALDSLSFTPGGSLPGSGSSSGGSSSSPGGQFGGGQFGGGSMGGFGPGGSSGSGGGAGSGGAGGNLAEGKGSGSAAPGTGTGAGPKAGGVGGGTAGKPGTAGGPMGGGGQKAEGSEDEEHQRKFVMEDDSAFQLNNEDGQKVIDPRTGLPLVPPVIGT
jgi:hypothetical protein